MLHKCQWRRLHARRIDERGRVYARHWLMKKSTIGSRNKIMFHDLRVGSAGQHELFAECV
jgi:hypothetical protein